MTDRVIMTGENLTQKQRHKESSVLESATKDKGKEVDPTPRTGGEEKCQWQVSVTWGSMETTTA